MDKSPSDETTTVKIQVDFAKKKLKEYNDQKYATKLEASFALIVGNLLEIIEKGEAT